jgi:hypothetical protein
MTYQSEVWTMLDDDEENQVWDKVYYGNINFSPGKPRKKKPFKFRIPVDIYDISKSLIWNDDEEINSKIRLALIECMKDDDYMYALDWQHTCFRYNPRIVDHYEYPVFIKYDVPIINEHVHWEGYNVWFPKFYPNGDYYFFIAINFSWGYLTHPWLKKAYVYGDCLREQFRSFADEIG